MAFVRRDPPWQDRELDDESKKGNRTITDISSGTSAVVKFSKDEGKVYEPKTDFTAERMEDLEDRIEAGFNAIEDLINPEIILNRFYPIGTIYTTFDNTNPSTLFGGTWKPISDGLLMPSDNLPETMVVNGQVSPQYTANNNKQTLTPKGSISYSISIGIGYADISDHVHVYSDRYVAATDSDYKEHDAGSRSTEKGKNYYERGNYPDSKFMNSSEPIIVSPLPAGVGVGTGHYHQYTVGNVNLALSPIPVNIEKPALTVYCWVRVA